MKVESGRWEEEIEHILQNNIAIIHNNNIGTMIEKLLYQFNLNY